MAFSFSKLHSRLIYSSLWCEPNSVRLLFITLLALADEDGCVYGSRGGLLRNANVALKPDEADPFDVLMAPDTDSSDLLRSPEYQGRRIEEIPGGFRLLNYAYYRQLASDEDRRERWRVRQARKRDRSRHVTPSHGGVTPSHGGVTPQERATECGKTTHNTDNKPSVTPMSRDVTAIHACHTKAEAEAEAEAEYSLSLARVRARELELEGQVVQHTEAKEILGKLSEDVFNKALRPTQWPSQMEHNLHELLPIKAADLAVVDWFYRLPLHHPILNVTARRQSMAALVESFDTEVQKVHSAMALLEVVRKKIPAQETGLGNSLPEENDGWGNGYREAALAEFGPEATLPEHFWDLGSDLRDRVKQRQQEMRASANGT